MSQTNSLDLLLKEIEDRYVQENFYRLKLYLERLDTAGGDITIIQGGGTTPAPTTADQINKVMGCAITTGVGQWVLQSLSANNFAEPAPDNLTTQPVIGIVIDKPTTTTCTVCLIGLVSTALARGRVYLSATGVGSNSSPASGYMQKLGISFGDGTMFVNPETTRIKRI